MLNLRAIVVRSAGLQRAAALACVSFVTFLWQHKEKFEERSVIITIEIASRNALKTDRSSTYTQAYVLKQETWSMKTRDMAYIALMAVLISVCS